MVFNVIMFLKKIPFLLRTAEFVSNVEHEPAGNGTTPVCCVRTASKTRTPLCAVQCVPASWTQSITKTYSSATLVRGKKHLFCNVSILNATLILSLGITLPW